MSYLTFHYVFLLPPIALMAAAFRQPRGLEGDWRVRWAIPLICLIAFTYTTPWDNYLVAREVWWYGPDRVVATIGYVPVEEYLFFVLQPILTGLFLYQYLGRVSVQPTTDSTRAPWGGTLAFAGLTALGAALLLWGGDRGLYLGLILAWAPPVLAGMWLYDGETLWALRSTVLAATGIPTLYLWGADAVAIHSGIWTISPEYTTGWGLFGLPIEEASFFLLTNLLVVQGVLLLLYGSHEAVTPKKATA